jgi:crotonobetainyl-CoA:carnitine CoA-transferase CaiB-like acyl-CoA transferase
MSEALFEGLKVLDVGSWIAGPVAGTMLADFGANVIKVEVPGIGDQYRYLSGVKGLPDAEGNYMWEMDGRNKRSLTLNLKTEAGIEVLHKLISECDVYITNQPFPVRDAFDLNYEDVKPLNPNMIYASLTAYGEKGPERDREGFDLVAYWARSGLMDLVHDAQAIPSQALPGMGDHPSAVSLYAAIVTALLKREKTGEGSMVHTSLLANGVWAASCIAQAGFAGGNYETFRAVRRTRNFPTTSYETADKRYFLFPMVRTPDEIDSFFCCLDLSELLVDDRFAKPENRIENRAELSKIIQAKMLAKTADAWQQLFTEQGIPAVLMTHIEEVVDDPQVYENNIVKPSGSGVLAPYLISHPVNVDGCEPVSPNRAPELGEHNDEILASLGYSPDDILKLRASKVI